MISPTFNIGPITVHYYGLIIAAATYIGWALTKKRAPIYKISKKIFDDPVLLVILAFAITGARLYHVLDYWTYYSQNPAAIFYISNGGIGIWGALFGGLVGLYVVAKCKKIPLLSTLDLIVPSLILGQAIGRLGNYINQEGFGPPTNLPWGVYIDPSKRPFQFFTASHFHPTFFYEMALDLFIFAALIFYARKSRPPGKVFALYLILYSASRFFVEFLRIDTWTIGTVKIAQVLGIAAFGFGLYLYFSLKDKTLT